MRRMWRLSLALIVAGPGPAFAQVSAPAQIRLATPVAPVSGSFAAGALAPALTTLSPGLSAPSLSAPALNASAPQALAPVLVAPVAPVAAMAAAAVPTAAVPSAAGPTALTAHPARPAPSMPYVPGEFRTPRTALEGLKTELEAPRFDESDLDGSRDHAQRSFDAKLGIESFVPEAVSAFTEGAFHPLAKINTPPPAQTGDDGGGPTVSRPIPFNGESFPSVAFRPNEPVETHIIRAIETAKKSIQISLYEFTSRGILSALLAAHKRGLKIEIILCDSAVNPRSEPLSAEEIAEGRKPYKRHRSEQIWALIRNGLDVRVIGRPTKYGISHHKFAVFDGKMVEFGSYNWTYTSEKSHYENVLFSNEAARVKAYKAAWAQQRALSVTVAESRGHQWPLDVPAPPSDAAKRISFNGIKLPAWVFTPSEEFEDSIAAAIDASKVSVDAAAFVFESRKIADALERALKRGVAVRIVADKSQTQYKHVQIFLSWIEARGAKVRRLFGPNGEESDFPLAEKMHNKFFIFDGKLVETGSANATKNAGVNNFENANFINDKTDAAAFVGVFDHMFDAAESLGEMAQGELPTDAQMRENVLQPRGPPLPPDPGPAPLPSAKRFSFNGADFPVSVIVPNEKAEPEIVKAIDSSKKTLRIAMYEFNQSAIWDALQRAKKRGVKIEIVLDRGHVYTTGYEDDKTTPRKPKQMVVDLIKDGGFDVILLKGRLGGIMHNKFILVDEGMVQFGSYNYTQQSEDDHYESIFFSGEKRRVAGYGRYFDYLQNHMLAEEPDLDKLDALISMASAWTDALDKAWDAAHARLEPEAAERAKKPLPPDPPQETETPIDLNGERFPIHLFSPNGGVEQALIRAIGAAKTSIDIAMFSFFSQPIAEALLRAKDNGIQVRIVMDRSQSGTSKLDDWFAWHGFDVRILRGPDDDRDPRYQKMHNKFAMFDGKMLENGSFNYSSRAETLSFENANFFDDADEIARFAAYFLQMFERGAEPKAPRREPTFAVPASGSEA